MSPGKKSIYVCTDKNHLFIDRDREIYIEKIHNQQSVNKLITGKEVGAWLLTIDIWFCLHS